MSNTFLNSCKKQWAFGLWVIIFLVVLVFGLWGHRMVVSFGLNWNFWHRWEVGALVSAIVFNIFFYVLGFFLPPKMFLHLKKPAYIGVVVLFEFFSCFCLGVATWSSLKEKSCLLQLLCLLFASVSFWGLDLVMARHSEDPRVREDFYASVALNDTPVILAFIVLFVFAWSYPNSAEAKGIYDVPFRAFIGGAIAFQMILSSWVMALIFRKPGEWYQDENRQTRKARPQETVEE